MYLYVYIFFLATFGISPFANLDSLLAVVVCVDPHKKKTFTRSRTHTPTQGFQLTPLACRRLLPPTAYLIVKNSLCALTG